MTLDLCDRPGKYSNGFCHWPQPAWISKSKGWVPSHANFTSLATPSAVGSGYTALVTLMHEGGHAAHFANVAQASPLFSQERAPTSVAYAENQSMFLDSLVRDSAWLARYALDRQGNVIPWDLIQRNIEATHAYQVLALRAMLAVPYFEKSLYELPEDQVTCQNILALAARVELDIQGGPSSRPLLSVPHILADESAAYYHGYVLADMSVYQTRAHFLEKYGFIVDNSQVGRDLERYYWQPGNSEQFLDLVSALTGKQLGPDAWIDHLEKSVENLVREERSAYLKALETGPKIKPGDPVDLSMQVKFVHGDERIADSKLEGLQNACQVYKQWVSNLK
jgi:Zn-dependent oligopeptidase